MLSRRWLLAFSVWVSLGYGCSSTPHGDQPAGGSLPPARCPAGLQARGPACLPIFDRCRDDEVALPGGGCKRVGPPSTCRAGWSRAKDGWCAPVLPAARCPKGTMAVIGKTTCQPVGDCGSGTWGKIKTTKNTIHVNRSTNSGTTDGSRDRPFPTIAGALKQAQAGAHIAIAAGTYDEDVQLEDKGGITLEGRCARMVIIRGQKKNQLGTVQVLADNSTLRGLTVTGPYRGIVINGAKVTVERCAISDNVHYGLVAAKDQDDYRASVIVRDCLFSGNRSMAVVVLEQSLLTMERSVVQDTKTYFDGKLWSAFGVWIKESEAIIKDSVVQRNSVTAVGLSASKCTLVGSVVADTRDRDGDTREGGVGIKLFSRSSLKLLDSVVARNRVVGVAAFDSTVQVERSVVRDTLPLRANNLYGFGFFVASLEPDSSSKLTLQDSLVADNAYMGIFFQRGDALIERVVVRDTGASPGNNTMAQAVYASAKKRKGDTGHHPSRVRIDHSLLVNNRYMGLVAYSGSDITFHRSTIRSTGPLTTAPESQGRYGVWVQENAKYVKDGYRASLKLTESLVEGSHAYGLVVACGGGAVLERSLFRDNSPAKGTVAGGVLAFFEKSCEQALQSPTLVLKDSGIQRASGAGIQLENATASVDRCVVEDTLGPFGDGISVVRGIRGATLTLTRGYVNRNRRAGVMFSGGGGKVCGSVLRGGTFAAVIDKGANPDFCEDNVFEDNKRNSIAFGKGLEPAPVPRIPKLPTLPEFSQYP